MFTLTIRTGNSAFYDEQGGYEPEYEVARILEDVAEKVKAGWDRGNLVDINGNHIGEWELN